MKRTSSAEILELLEALNIIEGDNILLHTSLFSLGHLDMDEANIIDLIKNKIGNDGNLVLPSFSYSYRRKEVFCPTDTSVSPELGLLPEIFRKRHKANRTWDGLFSFCSYNKIPSKFCSKNVVAFGNTSYLGYLVDNNYKLISLGVKFSRGITPFLHAERLAGVPYREETLFEGQIFMHGILSPAQTMHFSWRENWVNNYKTNRENFGETLVEKGVITRKFFKYGNHFSVSLPDFISETVKGLKTNPLIMLEKVDE